ncbi:MAG: chemotaxis protein CheB [Hymenobacteraceae bacterium]|nr:chemotaxis protein CheB [Hymenobacteraceae bacterium]
MDILTTATPAPSAAPAPVVDPPYVIVIGTSAGGMPALTNLICQLPKSLPAALLVVQHLAPSSSGEFLVDRLNRHCDTALASHLARDGMRIQAGHLYLAPPDRHLLVRPDGCLLVTKGPHESHYRPAVDALFRSAAVAFGARVVGVVLTGMLHDGTAGLEFVKRCGGQAVVQDPADAEFDGMPTSALQHVAVDHVVALAQMGAVLKTLVERPVPPAPNDVNFIPEDLRLEANIAERVVGTTTAVAQLGTLAPMTCPQCGGTLWQLNHGQVLRYRCHTGHAFSADALLKDSQEEIEETLWVALRMMEERKNLLASMATRGFGPLSAQQEERIEEMRRHINRLREFLLNGAAGAVPVDADGSANGIGRLAAS